MTNIQFNNIKNKEEFFGVFQGLCNIAESAFNNFEKQAKDADFPVSQIPRHISYLMSITFVIMGMRGDYGGFRDQDMLSAFFVEIDGVKYDQKYLYKMNDYFAERFGKTLEILKEKDLESYESYKFVWGKY